jgi:hypothetical protein
MPYNKSNTILKGDRGILMQNFILTRVAIDSLIDGTKLSIQNKSISESMAQIEQARELIQKLKQMSTSDQTAIVARRESTIEDLAIITAGKLKKVPRKKANRKGTLEQPLGTS